MDIPTPPTPGTWCDCGFWIKTPQAPSISWHQQMDKRWKGRWICGEMKGGRLDEREVVKCEWQVFIFFFSFFLIMDRYFVALISPLYAAHLQCAMTVSQMSWFASAGHQKIKKVCRSRWRDETCRPLKINERNCVNFNGSASAFERFQRSKMCRSEIRRASRCCVMCSQTHSWVLPIKINSSSCTNLQQSGALVIEFHTAQNSLESVFLFTFKSTSQIVCKDFRACHHRCSEKVATEWAVNQTWQLIKFSMRRNRGKGWNYYPKQFINFQDNWPLCNLMQCGIWGALCCIIKSCAQVHGNVNLDLKRGYNLSDNLLQRCQNRL